MGDINQKEMLEEIKDASPLEISRAEQKLLQEDEIDEDKLRDFCSIHLKAVEEEVEEMKDRLEKGHPIHTLISEHEEITEMLDELDDVIDSLKDGELTAKKKDKLNHIAEHLVESENHHEREEEALFPRMEKKGITGPTRIMKMDHEDMWPKKKKLLELSEELEKNEEEILELAEYLSFNLRDHIFKENNILYPSALDELENWDEIREDADEIGYCCFTPGEKRTEKGGS
ncbi:MAG: DUF438 domain-containing protein [Candidatus Thermoplasmatota archaeon]|nr:DUF438 domain-containing protein [Candidatus Thermoplasmatota archaeon]